MRGTFCMLFLSISLSGFSISISSICEGYWSDSITWDVGYPPGPGDSIFINHTVIMDIPVVLNTSGHVIVASSGHLCGANPFTGSFTSWGPIWIGTLTMIATSTNYNDVYIWGSFSGIGGSWAINGNVCGGCSFTCPQVFPCNVPPTAAFDSPYTSVCVGSLMAYNSYSQHAGTHEWTFQGGTPATSTTTNVNVSYAAPGTFLTTLVVTNPYGTDTLVDSVVVHPLPVVTSSTDTVMCLGDTIMLSSSSTAGDVFFWIPGTFVDCDTCPNTLVYPQYHTDYEVIYIDSNGCESRSETQVLVSSPLLDIGPDQMLCDGDSLELQANANLQPNWSTGDTTTTIYGHSGNTYWVEGMNALGCIVHDTIVLGQQAYPVANLGPDTSHCGAGVTLNGGSAISYGWSTGDSTASIVADSTGVFSVVLDNEGCSDEDSIVVADMSFVIDLGEDQVICEDTVTLDAGVSGMTYTWSTGEGTETVTVADAGTYTLAADNGTCQATDEVMVSVDCPKEPVNTTVFIANIFSPNNDDYNDELRVRGVNLASCALRVFNRWGEGVFATEDCTTGWDGTYKDEPVNAGVYVYWCRVTYMDGSEEVLKGNVTLVR